MARKRPARDELTLDIYARVSRLGDDRQRSTEGQVEDCIARVTEYGARVGEIHVDPGRSAWNPRVKRKKWANLMERLETGATGGAVVFDLARFSRRPIEGERLIMAAENGLVVLDSEGEYDLTSASGKKNFRDQLAAAAYESDRLSTRVKRGKRIKAVKGETNNSRRAFGWNDDNTTLRKKEAEALYRNAKRVLAGESIDAHVIEWNKRGLLTSTGQRWDRTTYKQALRRPRNAGIAVYDNEPLRQPSGDPDVPGDYVMLKDVEPIFRLDDGSPDIETWERLVTLFTSRSRGRPFYHLCSGIVRCGLCGTPLTGRPRKNMQPYPDGEVKRQYWCQPRAHRGGCGRIAIDWRGLDDHVRELTLAILADPRHAEAIETASQARADERADLEGQIERDEQLAAELAARLGRNELTLARFDAAIAPLDRRLAQLRARLAEVRQADAAEDGEVETDAATLAEWRARWEAAELDEKRFLIKRALRGRLLVVNPADPRAPRAFDPNRVEPLSLPESADLDKRRQVEVQEAGAVVRRRRAGGGTGGGRRTGRPGSRSGGRSGGRSGRGRAG